MADKRSSDQPESIPKKPPKQPARDYANLPQRPITLKQTGKKKSTGKTAKGSTKTKASTTARKKATKKSTVPRVKKKPSDQWLLKGISKTTIQYAQEEAERQGLSLEEWIEQLILRHQQSVTSEQVDEAYEAHIEGDLEQIAETLYAIEQRLDRIEEQRGFWSRFWEQVMNQSKP
jgi:predicted HNH restriction endonuclease